MRHLEQPPENHCFLTKYTPGLVFFLRQIFLFACPCLIIPFYTKYILGLVFFSRNAYFLYSRKYFFCMVLYSFFKYIIYSHCIFSVFKCFVFFSRKCFFLYNLVVHSFGYKIYSRPCPFFREIFISAYFPLSSLASGDFGKKTWFRKTRKPCEFTNSISYLFLGRPVFKCLVFSFRKYFFCIIL